ncbi:MAG: HAMP domain-containing histidine kinase [Phycicoccus sp.]|nr:HAMP domain-containing histidine kinase [Phycicoccus sp.]
MGRTFPRGPLPTPSVRERASRVHASLLAWTATPRRFVARWSRWVVRRWRESLQVRVVTTTVLLATTVILLLGTYLHNEIARGLENERIATSQYEARTLVSEAQRRFYASGATTVGELDLNASDIVRGLAATGPTPTRYVVMARSTINKSQTVLATVRSGDVSLSAIQPELRAAVAQNPTTQQTQIAPITLDGEVVPAVMVGSAVIVPTAGYYDLYVIYPMTQELQVMGIISQAFVIAGFVLVALVALIAWTVTAQVVTPVRRAAAVAQRLTSGKLNERMSTRGADELAQLGTSFNAMADSLQRQIRQLEGLSRVQQRFVSDVSHELRTPLTTIRMASDVIHDARGGFEPLVARSTELLEGELDRFEALLADLLEISRFDAGAAALDVEPIDLRSTIQRVVVATAPIAQRRGCEVHLALPAEPAVAEIDERRVERIIRNLVVNALEHSEGRPVRIEAATGGEAVAVVVSDSGVGLRPGEASMVFNRFWRADPARARTTGGTGLGLAISLEDARLHQGWLQAWGEPGVGSRFRLTLPAVADVPIVDSPLPLSPEDRQ